MYDTRPATPSDFELLHSFRAIAYRDHVVRIWGAWDEDDQRRRFQKNFKPERCRILLVEEREVGYLELEWSETEVDLLNIVLQPSHRRRGLGAYILTKEVLEPADARGIPVRLEVLKGNPAQRLYERLGFTLVGENQTHLVMQRESAKSRSRPDRGLMSDTIIHQRKADHIRIAAKDESSFRRKSTLLEEVELVHQALPELSIEEIDLSVTLVGKRLRLPLYMSGMTGGTEEARQINRGLARVAERTGIAFGLGSQRAMLKDPKWRSTYEVRDVAPGALIMANLGVVQAAQLSSEQVRGLIDDVGADALCIHLNPSMELIQAEGDRDFRGCVEAIRRLAGECGRPIIVKETGAGLSREAGVALAAAGASALDVAGAGGTSWVGIETLRAASDQDRALGEELWDWGIPTAASLLALSDLGVPRLASGGISRGIDAARALALGASAAGMAGAFLKAFLKGGEEEVERLLSQVERSLKAVALLIGARTVEDFWKKPKILGPRLRAWEEALRAGYGV